MIDATSSALSGVRAAERRMSNSAHNVANLTTESFRPLRTVQQAAPGGGSEALTLQEAEPRSVDLVRERVEQIRAGVQARASARVLAAELELRGSLVDLEV